MKDYQLGDLMFSENRRKYIKAWKKRIFHHLLNPSLVIKRIKSPKQSALLFISPFIDKKLKSLKPAEADSILANTLKVVVALNDSQTQTIKAEDSPFAIDNFIDLTSVQENLSHLNSLFEQYGSDKARNRYSIFYQTILEERLKATRNNIQIFEIGLGTNNVDVPSNMGLHGKPGASLRAFRDYSPRISVVGADVDSRILFQEERISTFFVDQLKKETFVPLLELAQASDVIIDDGLHTSEANLNVIYSFKDVIKLGSWIVIEDIGKTELNLKLWGVVRTQLNEFRTILLELPNTYIFLAQKIAKGSKN